MTRALPTLAGLLLWSVTAAGGALWSAELAAEPTRLTPQRPPRSDEQVEPAADGAGKEVAAPSEGDAPGEPAAQPAAQPAQPRRQTPQREVQGLSAALSTPDLARLPRFDAPVVVPGLPDRVAGINGAFGAMIGWSGGAAAPELVDRQRRPPLLPRPASIGATLLPGERFRYDVTFSGNPTGIAEAKVTAREPGPFGGPERLRLDGFARTSGVVSLLTTLTYEITSWVDALSGAPVEGQAITKRTSLGKSRRRDTQTTFAGRGMVEVTDTRQAEATTKSTIRRRIPADTFDTLSIMAWVRALDLAPGERARTHALDGKILLRVEIVGKGPSRLEPMPSIGTALGLAPEDVYEVEGSITRVDSLGVAMVGKKTYKMRAWISDDGRRIPLVLESDIWLGVVRLILTQYDPPQGSAGERDAP
jgi:hypothetical protein